MNRRSVATISSPEFINITSISPFASKCEIKVLYLGQNRNHSFIDKTVAAEMAQTLPGCPIVGYYSENQEDFRDHGEQVVIDGDGVKFKCQTVPYGFVAPDAKVWFKEFEDTDEFGNTEIRTYLMTEGYLWTEQYKEAQKVINEGRPQSMELDSNTLKGRWSTDKNSGVEFFIINDAIFSKLCILGEDVEPCFEGSSVTAPNVSSTFSKDDNFVRTLDSMLKELKELTFSLKQKGGNSMELQTENFEAQQDEVSAPVTEEVQQDEAEVSTPVAEEAQETSAENENFSENSDKNVLEVNAENQSNTEEFVKKDEEDKEEDKEDTDKDEDKEDAADEEDEDKKKVAKNTLEENYALLESNFNELQEKYSALESENAKLLEFKANIENKEKDALIDSFYMLSDEDKKDVIENKANYSLEDIEAKLSVICVRKKVNFNLDNDNADEKENDSIATVFNLNEVEDNASVPAWIKAVDARRNAD